MAQNTDTACDTDATAAQRERAERIHQQIEELKLRPAGVLSGPPKSPRDFIADRKRSTTRRKKK